MLKPHWAAILGVTTIAVSSKRGKKNFQFWCETEHKFNKSQYKQKLTHDNSNIQKASSKWTNIHTKYITQAFCADIWKSS